MSEKTLDKLIATLKSEAIEAADKKASETLEKAYEQARNIIGEAEAKREEMLEQAEKEARATLDKGESALKQAARDLSVSVRNDLLMMLKGVLEQEVETAFTPELVEKAVLKIVENVGSGVTLKLPGKMETGLARQIQKRLQDAQDLASITADPALLNGFSLTKDAEGWSYQITPEEVTELLYTHLSPKWVHLLKDASDT